MEYVKPEDIEKRSLEIIGEELAELRKERQDAVSRSDLEEAMIRRAIHTTADFSFDVNMVFTYGAAEKAYELLRGGCTVVTDTNMGLTGLNKRALAQFGGSAYCFMADADVAADAKSRGVTRAEASVDKAASMPLPLIYAVGNAPTALFRIAELYRAGKFNPSLVIACPVGFVNVVESKEQFLDLPIPAIIARGRKGGSAVAATILNAALYYRLGERP